MMTPYKALRTPKRDAVAIPLIAEPPAPMTPMTANCDAPENVRSDRRQLWRTENPLATDAAPKATPYAPTVKETLMESLNVVEETVDTRQLCRINP
jgi:hypothetical protein